MSVLTPTDVLLYPGSNSTNVPKEVLAVPTEVVNPWSPGGKKEEWRYADILIQPFASGQIIHHCCTYKHCIFLFTYTIL